MKKKAVFLMATLLLAGCSPKEEVKSPNTLAPTIEVEKTAQPVKTPKEERESNGYQFTYKNIPISVNTDVASLLSSLGDAKKKTNYKSKAFVGNEKVYEYEGIRIATYPGDSKDYIGSIVLTDAAIPTGEGIKVGDSKQKVEEVYKNAKKEMKDNCLTVTSDDTMIRFILMDNHVAAIDYYPVLRNKELKNDKTAPEVVNAFEMTFYTDQKKADVDACRYTRANDMVDVNARVVVDSSKVDLSKCGDYKVKIYAYDRAGNSSVKETTYTVAQKTSSYTEPDKIDERADRILSSIITDGMSTTQKTDAIYNWIRSNFNFVDTSDKTDWLQTANDGLKRRSGDCFTYYAVAQELLTRAGMQSIRVQKNPGYNETHYWSLVNIPNQGWYHYDTTPRVGGGVYNLVTDQWLQNYSVTHGNSHDYDPSKYPATPKKDVVR